jgi:cytochrome b
MPGSNESVRVWDWPLRLFHWTLVIAIAVAFLSAEEDSPLNQWHVISGWVVAILIVFRLVWGFVGGEHSRFSDFVRLSRVGHHLRNLLRGHRQPCLGHNPLGAMAVVVLLTLAAATVWTGAFGGDGAEDLHEVIGWTLLAVVGIHVAAVVIMSMLERENLIRAMITGNKPAIRHPGAISARPPRLIALIAALAVAGGAAYLILKYDPQAFTLRSARIFEHRTDAGGNPTKAEPESEERD